MYDIEFFVPVTTRDHWGKRLNESKDLLLQNIDENQSVRLVLLTGPNEQDDQTIETGWPARIDIQQIKTPHNTACQKVFHYYNNIALDRCQEVKWFARIDDDSWTDVNGLLKMLNEEYDWKFLHHIGGIPRWDSHPVERALMERMGYGHYYQKTPSGDDVAPVHEHEMGITSSAAMKTTLENPKSAKLLNMRENISDGWGDHCFALAAKISGINLCINTLISTNGSWEGFAKWNGPHVHIHPIQTERFSTEDWKIIKEIICGETNYNAGDYKLDLKEKVIYITFKNNGEIQNLESQSIGKWSSKNNDLILCLDNTQSLQYLTTGINPQTRSGKMIVSFTPANEGSWEGTWENNYVNLTLDGEFKQ